MSAARHPRRAIVVALAGAVLLLSACSTQQAGSAATMGETRITETELNNEVQQVLEAQGLPLDTADAAVTSTTLGRMIVIYLVDIVAAREGVAVTQGRIDESLAAYVAEAGDQAAMEASFAQQGVAPSQIQDFVELNIQAQDIGIALAPNGSAEEQGAAVFDAVSALSVEMDVTTSPRFGTWDPLTLQVGPVADDLSMLPAPAQ